MAAVAFATGKQRNYMHMYAITCTNNTHTHNTAHIIAVVNS